MARLAVIVAVIGIFGAVAGTAAAASFTATGSAEQVYALGLSANARASLLNAKGKTVYTQRADSDGGLLFRNVTPGTGYRVRLYSHGAESAPVTVHSDAPAPWDPSVYNQTINDSGYQYVTVRDGVKLAIDVHPPPSPTGAAPSVTLPAGDYAPPYPTLIEYAGYGYADPAGPDSGIAAIANLMGFAVVDVNMRGTGCSGGAYDFFETLQQLDAYDVIQTIAHQPWVLGHKVGMMGISYGAISQLFAAQDDPPALEAIAPLSTIDATASTLYPGGELNTGFAVAWALQRQQQAQPAGPNNGTEPYAWKQIQSGDQTCKSNQDLHGEAANLSKKIKANALYHPSVADPLDPVSFVNKIHVPVFMACQFTDEQTGGHCPDLVQHMTGTNKKWFTFTNGAHIDSLDPYTADHWFDFLELFVAHQAPVFNSALFKTAAPVVYQQALGTPSSDVVSLPNDPIQSDLTYSSALADFEKLPEVTVAFDNGAGTSPTGATIPGNPYPGFVKGFSTLPVPGTTAGIWYFGAKGTLASAAAAHKTINWFNWNAHTLPMNDFGSNTETGGLWGNATQWSWNWKQNPSGTAVAYVSSPLKTNTTVVGAGAVHVWVRANVKSVDLQATVSEVRPDGNETFVQDGWLRTDERKLATDSDDLFKTPSTLLAPIPSELPKDVKAMPKGKFVEVVIPLYYEGHVYRAGSRIRITISAPNGTQPIWAFAKTSPKKTTKVSVEFSRTMPSSLILPVVPGVSVPTPLPPCPGLRNEPCRKYVPLVNRVSSH